MLTAWILGLGPAATPLATGFATGFATPLATVFLALALDAALGDPAWLYRAVPHPVALLGRLIEKAERKVNRTTLAAEVRRWRGLVLTWAVVALAAGLGLVLAALLAAAPGGWIAEAVLASSLLAFRGLYDQVGAVARGLERSLTEGRAAVAHVVGRDPDKLDGPGVARAAIESLAENFSDGVVAPLFWYALLGLPGLLAYKAVNTLDSMLGHRSPRYADFGRAAARLDDLVNLAPARLAGGIVVAAAFLVPGADGAGAWRAMLRDAPRHRSPNAGWQEAAFAGALGLALAGPRIYGGKRVDDHWMGDGRRDLSAADIRAALRFYWTAGAICAGILALLWVLA